MLNLEHAFVFAQIPIIKFVDKQSSVSVDMCFDVAGGLKTAKFINEVQRKIPAMRPLTLVMKYFLWTRGLNDTYTGTAGTYDPFCCDSGRVAHFVVAITSGGAGSFLLQLMIISFLQVCCVQ